MVFRRRNEKPQEQNEPEAKSDDAATQRLQSRVDALDRRLDNIDSMVTAVAERVMSRPMILNISCPHCGKSIEISLIGDQKPGK